MTVKEKEQQIEALRLKIQELELIKENEGRDSSQDIIGLKEQMDVLRSKIQEEMTPWDRVLIARTKNRPTTLCYIEAIVEDFIEFHGDRYYGDDTAIVGGIGTLDGTPVTIIGEQKGLNTKDNIYRNFGMPSPEGYRKALRLMHQAEKFGRPIINFIDTPGAFCGISAEERGQGEAIARNLYEMSNLSVPIISIVIGEGGSGGALAIAVADKIYMLENSIYSILSPEGFASILWKDGSKAKDAAGVMKITADDLKKLGIIDKIITEPVGGAHNDPEVVCKSLKKNLLLDLKALGKKSQKALLEDRYKRFREYGVFDEK